MNTPTIPALTSELRIVEFADILQFLKDVGDYSNYYRDVLVDRVEGEYGKFTLRMVPLCLIRGDTFISLACQIVEDLNDTNPDSPLNLLVDALEEVGEWGSFHVNIANAN